MKFNRDKYLNRIKYSGELKPDLSLLKKLQKHHLLNIPFENLDIHYQTPIELNIDRIYEKIVQNNRGGFCYELNGLFYELLLSLGFNAKQVSARVYEKENEYSPEFDHLSIVVKIENTEYLTDVGFGEFIFEPLELHFDKIQKDSRGSYVIDKYDGVYLRVSKIKDGKSIPEFIFKNAERELAEYAEMCKYHQSNPNSHFMKKRLISLPTENGRITISGNTLKIKEKNKVTEKELKNEIEFEKELLEKFKININKPVADNIYTKSAG
jgi:N-hydroxyarylamine O-acetyltransferase